MDVAEAFRRAADDFERVVVSLDEAAWEQPTVCDVPVRERRVAPHLEEKRMAGAYGRGASGLQAADAPALELLLDAFGRRP